MNDLKSKKKLLEKPLFASMVVPVAVILVSALIIFGITRMLSSERNHRDLISELQSKTFGNRWVAAYELSKILAAKKIPESEELWVIENLSGIYNSTPDARTRNFIILALGTFNRKEILPTLDKAIVDSDSQVQFNAVVILGNLPPQFFYDWSKMLPLLDSADVGLQQATVLALSHHKFFASQDKIRELVKSSDDAVRYAAAMGLIEFQSLESKEILKEVLFKLSASTQPGKGFNESQVESLKLNIINAIGRNKMTQYNDLLEQVMKEEKNIKVSTKAKEIFILLKE
jgi:HEAT repeat protein